MDYKGVLLSMTNETRPKDRLLALIFHNYNKWSIIIPKFIAISQIIKNSSTFMIHR